MKKKTKEKVHFTWNSKTLTSSNDMINFGHSTFFSSGEMLNLTDLVLTEKL